MTELVGVSYCGRDDGFVDTLYGTGLEFFKGKARELPNDLAAKFLYHEGQFERVDLSEKPSKKKNGDDTADVLAKADAKKKAEDKKQDAVVDAKNQIAVMTKAGLIEYAQIKYKHELNAKLKVDEIRAEVSQLIDQFGIL